MRHNGRLSVPRRKAVPTRRTSKRFRSALSKRDVYGRTTISCCAFSSFSQQTLDACARPMFREGIQVPNPGTLPLTTTKNSALRYTHINLGQLFGFHGQSSDDVIGPQFRQ